MIFGILTAKNILNMSSNCGQKKARMSQETPKWDIAIVYLIQHHGHEKCFSFSLKKSGFADLFAVLYFHKVYSEDTEKSLNLKG